RNNMFMHGVKNDSVLGFTKFVSKYEIRQVYGMLIPDVLVSKEMMESKTYKTYLDFAIGKETLILTALELAKSISRTKAEEQEATRLVHETHERLVTEQPTWRRRQTGVTIRDTPTVTKKKTPAQPLKLKGMEMLLDAAIPTDVPDKSKGKTNNINEGAGSKPKVLDVSKAMSSDQESENGSWGESEEDDDHKSDDERTESDNDTSINLNKTDSKEEPQGDEFVHTFDDYV
nr:hypothetical protein [Tanacetum cinerariifolium]